MQIITYVPEYLKEFVQRLPQNLFKKATNHDSIDIIEPETLYVFCKTEKNFEIEIVGERIVPLNSADIGRFFKDLEQLKPAPGGEAAILLEDLEGNLIGYYFPKLRTVWASDWSHDQWPEAWNKLASFLVNLLGEGTKCTVCGKKATTFFPLPLCAEHARLAESQSQKAKGLIWLSKHAGDSHLFTSIVPVRLVKRVDDKHLSQLIDTVPGKTLFVRACPVHPRHGVLESEPAPREKATAVVRRMAESMAKTGEADGDIAIQPFLVAWGPRTSNIVWGPGAVVAAPGYDGVTAGRHPQITLKADPPDFYYTAISDLGLKEAEIEAVINEGHAFFTQIRAAAGHFKPDPPPPGAVPGFAPHPINLDEATIVKIRGLKDVMELEALEAEGDVVVVHYGGSILSHAAAWCRERGYAYAALSPNADRPAGWMSEPARGWVVFTDSPPKESPEFQTEVYPEAFRKGLELGLKKEINLPIVKQTFRAAIVFHHYATQTSLSPTIAQLAGWFAGVLARTGLAISYGELRHATPEVVGGSAFESLQKIMDGAIKSWIRNHVHKHFFKYHVSPKTAVQLLNFAVDAFEEGDWGESYGGPPWAKIAALTLSLWENIELFLKGENSLTELVGDANRLLNLAHNTGWAFNKVAHKEWLDLAEKYSSFPMAFIESLHDAIYLLLKIEELADAKASSIIAPDHKPHCKEEEGEEDEKEEKSEKAHKPAQATGRK